MAAAATVLLGLASRNETLGLTRLLGDYPGDALWALLVFLLFALAFSSWSTRRVAAIAACFALAIELSQLYHTAWIDAIRRTTLGGLVLGYGFLWSDLVCYAAGILIGTLIDRWLWRPQ